MIFLSEYSNMYDKAKGGGQKVKGYKSTADTIFAKIS